MTCPATGACLVCRIAGLIECPFREREPAVLPLVEAEKPKVTYTRTVVYPPWDWKRR